MFKTSTSRVPFRLFTVVMGVGLLAYLILKTGAGTIIEQLRVIGWGLVVILALGGVAHLIKASAWRLTFRSEMRKISLARAFGLRLIAEAIGNFGIAGQVVGDSMRVSLMGADIPIPDRISSVALDRAAALLGSAIVGVTGILTAVVLLSLHGIWRIYALVVSGSVTLVFALGLLSFFKGKRLFSRIAGAMQRLPWARKWVAEKVGVIESAEDNLLSFRSRAPKSFWAVIGLYLLYQMMTVAEVYLLLRFMGVRISSVGAFVVEGLTKLIDIIGAVNPGNIGTYEGGNLLVAHMLGFPAAAGLTLALCRRARILFWAAIGAGYLTVCPRQMSGDVPIPPLGPNKSCTFHQ